MAFAGISYLAVFVAAVAGWLVGAAWYNVLARHWLAAQGRSLEAFKQEQAALKGNPKTYLPFVLAFVASLVMAWVLAGLIGHLGQVTIRAGIISGAFAWLGFVVTTIAVNYAFGGRTWRLFVIDAGHWLALLLVQGAIIGAFGV
jgi:Protein of unknown function (DUF1761)